MKTVLCDTTDIDAQIEAKSQELSVLSEMVRKHISDNATRPQDQDEYEKIYQRLVRRFEKAKRSLEALNNEREARVKKGRAIQMHINLLKNSKRVLTEWDSTVWTVMVEKAVVHRNGSLTFHFYNGQNITVGA